MILNIIISLSVFVLSYLLGSIPSAYIAGKIIAKSDIRKMGSGNVGGANAARLFGKKIGLIVGLFDVFKGYLAVILTKYILNNFLSSGFFLSNSSIVAISAFLAVSGHCFSLFLKFTGGKGGATTAGVLLAISPPTAFIVFAFWIFIIASTRFTSLGNLFAVLIIPITIHYYTDTIAYSNLGIALIILIYFTHRANINRLINGIERKFGETENI